MSLTAAAGGFVVFLLCARVIQSQNDWGVTYISTETDPPKLPSVSVSPSGEIVEGSSVTLTCSGDANPAANYTWFRRNVNFRLVSRKLQLVFRSIQSSDSGEYYCTAENRLRKRTSARIHIDVKYAPKLLSVSVSPSGEIVEGSSVTLTCSSDANPAATYTWYKENQQVFQGQSGIYHLTSIRSEHRGNYSCKSENQHGHKTSSSVLLDVQYPPKLPSVSVSPSGEIVEGSSVNLTCSSDANPAATYTWFRRNVHFKPLSKDQQFVFRSIQSSDFGEYYCTAENKLENNWSKYISIDVKYPPRLPSVSVRPSGKIMEGSSVTLTCSSDAKPAATYTWYKGNQQVFPVQRGIYHLTSIRSEHRGNYSCKSENQYGQKTSSSVLLDVQYAPKLPSVSVSLSGEIVEGSSVNLTCSSDANPAATYTWYKENEDSPKASGQIFTITDFTAEDHLSYFCEAQNKWGRHNSTFHLSFVEVNPTTMMNIIRLTLVILMLIPLVLLILWTRKKKSLISTMKPHQPPETIELNSLSANENDSNLRRTQTDDTEDYEEIK